MEQFRDPECELMVEPLYCLFNLMIAEDAVPESFMFSEIVPL